MSDQIDGLSNHALQNSASNQLSFSPSINNDLKKPPPLFMCGECLQLFLDLDEGTQHWRKCKSNSKTGDLCLTSGSLELSIDVVRYLVDSEASSLIPNETNGENQQSTDSMNEPTTTKSIANQSPVESNHQQSIGDNAHPILEQTGLNGLVDDQSITAVNETSIQDHSRAEVEENPQPTYSMNESAIPRSIPNKSPVESNHQQSIGDNAHPILEQTGLNGLVDNQPITAVNETCVQNHSGHQIKENLLNANLEKVDSKTSSNYYSEKPYKCEECLKCFPNKSKLNWHFKIRHRDIGKFKCEECPKSYSLNSNLNAHIRAVHRKIRQFKCEECSRCFAQKTNLKRHIQSVHQNIFYMCKECSKCFRGKYNLKIHIKTVHQNILYKCEECIKFFRAKFELKIHIKAVHQDIWPFKCEVCSKGFTRKLNLNRHTQTVHQNIRPFKCEECSKSFSQKRDLDNHTQSVHRTIRPFNCEECTKSFKHQGYLNKHIRSVHRGIRPFKCEECIKSYTQKRELDKHTQSVHRTIRPFNCEECIKSFKLKGFLNKHIRRVHRGIRPCKEGPKIFLQKSDFNKQ